MTSVTLEEFRKHKDFLICVDSDGCAVNNLTAKHRRCFGPCLIREWQLEKWQEKVLALWERINLYGLTRGIHRFRALEMALEEIDERLTPVEELRDLTEWVENTESAACRHRPEACPDPAKSPALVGSCQCGRGGASLGGKALF